MTEGFDVATADERRGFVSSALVIVIFLAAAGNAVAHPALYHYLEINLLEPGAAAVFVTVHAPELTDTVAPLDADVFGKEWLSTRNDETIVKLVESANHFADQVFAFRFGEREVQPSFAFPEPETIRHPGPDSSVPEGCFSGESILPYQFGEETLFINFSLSAQKRLMLIINRPASFPEVIDLEPGSQYTLALPAAPVSAYHRRWLEAAPVLTAVLILVMALIRRRRACLR